MVLKETPTDSYGMPLQILSPLKTYNVKATNKHHLWHPNASLLVGNVADRALRHSIVQRLPKWVHNDYHSEYGGPVIPNTDSDKFFLTILGRIGYRTEEVLNFNKNGKGQLPYHNGIAPYINVFPDHGPIGIDGQDSSKRVTGLFLAQYAIEQNVGHLAEIDEFLNSPDYERRLELGAFIIEEGIRVAVDPYTARYKHAVVEGRIPKGQRSGLFNVVTGIFRPSYIPNYIEPLTKQLQAA